MVFPVVQQFIEQRVKRLGFFGRQAETAGHLKRNVLRFFLEDGSWFAVRPSGTEPKIKFYFYAKDSSQSAAIDKNRRIREEIFEKIRSVR